MANVGRVGPMPVQAAPPARRRGNARAPVPVAEDVVPAAVQAAPPARRGAALPARHRGGARALARVAEDVAPPAVQAELPARRGAAPPARRGAALSARCRGGAGAPARVAEDVAPAATQEAPPARGRGGARAPVLDDEFVAPVALQVAPPVAEFAAPQLSPIHRGASNVPHRVAVDNRGVAVRTYSDEYDISDSEGTSAQVCEFDGEEAEFEPDEESERIDGALNVQDRQDYRQDFRYNAASNIFNSNIFDNFAGPRNSTELQVDSGRNSGVIDVSNTDPINRLADFYRVRSIIIPRL
ncbi:uncharacterized protein LOC106648700 [Trichogramma pretiosum]|uniref:uncharacterized protein LOC106648700 n=1 Tax=Trichogramma pretiosum TaxID=7493 RepID=UPI0006C953D5|nr:uncharacterized protein LOC106648700 [Trichogramma pretiosum]